MGGGGGNGQLLLKESSCLQSSLPVQLSCVLGDSVLPLPLVNSGTTHGALLWSGTSGGFFSWSGHSLILRLPNSKLIFPSSLPLDVSGSVLHAAC